MEAFIVTVAKEVVQHYSVVSIRETQKTLHLSTLRELNRDVLFRPRVELAPILRLGVCGTMSAQRHPYMVL